MLSVVLEGLLIALSVPWIHIGRSNDRPWPAWSGCMPVTVLMGSTKVAPSKCQDLRHHALAEKSNYFKELLAPW